MRVITKSETETEDLGYKIGEYIKARGAGTVCLYGDLGAGKTTMIRGIASALGIPRRDISSASFVMVSEYETSPPFFHIDLYRAERQEDLEELGIWEHIGGGAVSVIEWAERLPEVPEHAVRVKMSYCDKDSREIIIEGTDEL